MNRSRRDILRRASLLPTLTLGFSGIAAAADCSDVAAWDTETVYDDGDQVLFDDFLWNARWWTQGDEPGTKQWGPWEKVSTCRGGTALTAIIDANRTFVAVDEPVEFDAGESTGSVESYEWDFDNDGSSDATGQTVSHVFDTTGDRTVSLTVTGVDGFTDTATVTVTVTQGGLVGSFPENFFAPYVDVTLAAQDPLVESVGKAGTKYFILAFITAGSSGEPAWAGVQPIDEPSDWLDVGTQIRDLRRHEGGSVIVSFGGLQGTYLPETTDSATELKNKYKQVIETYGVSFLDFDEEKLIRSNPGKVSLRNEALVLLKQEYPELKISYTLPVLPSGFPSHSTNDILFALEDAAERGLDVDMVNPMTMNYGSSFELIGRTVIDAAQSVHGQLGDLWPEKSATERWQMIGLTPMIGQNDVDSNVFDQNEARQVRDFAIQQNLRMLSFWSLVRDDGEGDQLFNDSLIPQEPYEFSHLFNDITSQ